MYVLEAGKIRVEYSGFGRLTMHDSRFSGVWMRFLLEAKEIFRSVGIPVSPMMKEMPTAKFR